MKIIIYPTDKGLSIISPATTISLSEIIAKRFTEKDLYLVLDVEDLPKDNEFVAAWEIDFNSETPVITINLEKAKIIWKNKMRAARKPLLEKLDVEYIKALENNDLKAQKNIITKKQALRQITDLYLPNNLDELKNFWPEILNQ